MSAERLIETAGNLDATISKFEATVARMRELHRIEKLMFAGQIYMARLAILEMKEGSR